MNWKGLRKKTLWPVGYYPDRPKTKLEKSVKKKYAFLPKILTGPFKLLLYPSAR